MFAQTAGAAVRLDDHRSAGVEPTILSDTTHAGDVPDVGIEGLGRACIGLGSMVNL